MTCELSLTGQIVIGGSGCGCSGSPGGNSATKVQPLGFSCPGQAFGAVQSTDCAVPISSPVDFIPLPIGALSSISLLFVQTSAEMVLRYGGAKAKLTGTSLGTTVSFAGGEVFAWEAFDEFGTKYSASVTFSAGVLTLEQVVNQLNAGAVTASAKVLPASLAGSQLVLTGINKGAKDGLLIGTALALIGFAATDTTLGEEPTEISINGSFLSQFSPTISDVEIKGVGNVTILAAGSA